MRSLVPFLFALLLATSAAAEDQDNGTYGENLPKTREQSCVICLSRYANSCKSECASSNKSTCIKFCQDKHCNTLCDLPAAVGDDSFGADDKKCSACKTQAAQKCAQGKRCRPGPGFEACTFRCEREACKTSCGYFD